MADGVLAKYHETTVSSGSAPWRAWVLCRFRRRPQVRTLLAWP